MVVYEYECPTHGRRDHWLDSSADRTELRQCPVAECPEQAQFVWSVPQFESMVWDNKHIPGLGTFNSKSAINEAMKRKGKIWNEAGMDKDIERNHRYKIEKEEAALDSAIENNARDICAKAHVTL